MTHAARRVSLLRAFVYSTPTVGADWVVVHMTDDYAVYIDAAGIRFRPHETRAWFLWNYAHPQTMEGPARTRYFSVKSLALIDCERRRRAILKAYYYREPLGIGPVVGSATSSKRVVFDDVIPDTVGDMMIIAACETRHEGVHLGPVI